MAYFENGGVLKGTVTVTTNANGVASSSISAANIRILAAYSIPSRLAFPMVTGNNTYNFLVTNNILTPSSNVTVDIEYYFIEI